jgi:hypothetical protein
VPPDVAVQGQAVRDGNFLAPQDRIAYRIPIDASAGPLHVRAELWYQPIAYRWAQNLREQDAAEIERFTRYYEAMSRHSGIMLTMDQGTVP